MIYIWVEIYNYINDACVYIAMIEAHTKTE